MNNHTQNKKKLIQFPCRFAIKVVMSVAQEGVEQSVLDAFHKYFPPIAAQDIQTKVSSGGKYQSLTITVTAESQEQLDQVYQAVSKMPGVAWML